MEAIIEFGKIILPAAAVMYAMYLTIKSFVNKELEKYRMEIRGRSIETVLPNRLHAYERVCLFLERISPDNMIIRLNNGEYSAREFQQILLNEIREEYNHNVSQQLYMSNEVWEMVKNAKENLIMSINEVTFGLPETANSIDLSKQLMDKVIKQESDLIRNALYAVKNEIKETF